MGAAAPQNFIKHESPVAQQRPPQTGGLPSDGPPKQRPPPPAPMRQSSQTSNVPGVPPVGSQVQPRQDYPQQGQQGPPPQQGQVPPQHQGGGQDDTMSNLKKTFAGIFGDM